MFYSISCEPDEPRVFEWMTYPHKALMAYNTPLKDVLIQHHDILTNQNLSTLNLCKLLCREPHIKKMVIVQHSTESPTMSIVTHQEAT